MNGRLREDFVIVKIKIIISFTAISAFNFDFNMFLICMSNGYNLCINDGNRLNQAESY